MTASLGERLAAASVLVEEARKLIAAQEQEVARMRAAGLNPGKAQGLLDAYRASLRLADQEKTEVEEAMEHEELIKRRR
jgi:hypothetical protein